MRTNLAQQVASDVRKHFADKVYSTIIPRNVKLSEAPGFGKPIIAYDPDSSGAKGYMDLAREFIARHPELSVATPKRDSGDEYAHSV